MVCHAQTAAIADLRAAPLLANTKSYMATWHVPKWQQRALNLRTETCSLPVKQVLHLHEKITHTSAALEVHHPSRPRPMLEAVRLGASAFTEGQSSTTALTPSVAAMGATASSTLYACMYVYTSCAAAGLVYTAPR